MDNEMTMSFEYISPEMAKEMLKKNVGNRNISQGVVKSYANDILSGNWDERIGDAISFTKEGHIKNGQHRLSAIALAQKGIWTWVCRGVSDDGIYDNNRRRSIPDQLRIVANDLDSAYRDSRYLGAARIMIRGLGVDGRRKVSPREVIEFTRKHKDDLDGFFLRLPTSRVPKIYTSTIVLALCSAYYNGVSMDDILSFYRVLTGGMSTCPEEFPVIAYRNFLLNRDTPRTVEKDDICRCQVALKNYLDGTCNKRIKAQKELVYPIPYSKKEAK